MRYKNSITSGPTESDRTIVGKSVTGLTALKCRYPEMFREARLTKQTYLKTGDVQFDSMFPGGGLPTGLLVELTGAASSGKTAVLFHLLAGYQYQYPLAYIDSSSTFFPLSAITAGIKVEQILVVTTDSSCESVRLAENLFRLTPTRVIACDVTGRNDKLKMEQMHRLRIITTRYQGMVIFLTDSRYQLFPPSLISLQLTVTRCTRNSAIVTVTRSKISPEGKNTEMTLV